MIIQTKKDTNDKLNWHGRDPVDVDKKEKYFKMLRALMLDCAALNQIAVDEILKKHNVYFVELEGESFPRVNLDIPEGRTKHGDR